MEAQHHELKCLGLAKSIFELVLQSGHDKFTIRAAMDITRTLVDQSAICAGYRLEVEASAPDPAENPA